MKPVRDAMLNSSRSPRVWDTHYVCQRCYDLLEPGREAVRTAGPNPPSTCCRCGMYHRSGIYYRAETAEMSKCRGHKEAL